MIPWRARGKKGGGTRLIPGQPTVYAGTTQTPASRSPDAASAAENARVRVSLDSAFLVPFSEASGRRRKRGFPTPAVSPGLSRSAKVIDKTDQYLNARPQRPRGLAHACYAWLGPRRMMMMMHSSITTSYGETGEAQRKWRAVG